MWWLILVLVIGLLAAAWATRRAVLRRRTGPADIELWRRNRDAAARARERPDPGEQDHPWLGPGNIPTFPGG